MLYMTYGDVVLVLGNIILYSFHHAVNLDMEKSLNETGYQVLRVQLLARVVSDIASSSQNKPLVCILVKNAGQQPSWHCI